MKKFLVGGLAAVALVAPATASAQTLPDPVVTVTGKVSNTNAGTKKKPTAAKLTFGMVNSAASQATVSRIIFDLPVGVKLDGSNLPSCSEPTLRSRGPAGCKSAQIGTGVAYVSIVNRAQPAPDCAGTRGAAGGCITFSTTFVIGGKRIMYVYLQGITPGFESTQRVLTGRINTPGRRLTLDIPRDTQSPVTGAFTALQELSGSWFKTRKARGRVNSFVSTTSCPARRVWAFTGTLEYVNNPLPPNVARESGEATQRCRP